MSFSDSFPLQLDNLSQLCRLCLNSNINLFRLFDPDETDIFPVSLSMKVSLCISLSISKNDNLPQKICEKCLNLVNEWYSFRKQARKIHSFLKERIMQCQKEVLKEPDEVLENSRNSQKVHSLLREKLIQIEKEVSKEPDEVLENSQSYEGEEEVKIHLNVTSLKAGDPMVKVPKKKHKCFMCPDSFYFVKDLKSHIALLHSHIKPEVPQQAPLNLGDDTKLEGINIRTRYEMKCCGKVFFSRLKFRKHYNEKHPGEKPFMCETCGKKDFISEETLKRHKVLHSGKFRCEICQKTFTCNAILILHKRDKHENDKPFICDVCGKRFVTELLMNYHKRSHTGEKKYVCDECGLAVGTSSSLAKHKRTHKQEKPHVCHVCGKGFIIKGRLVEHLRVHTGERPYCCHICQKGFAIKDKLKRHMRVHSGEKSFSCEYCGNTYSTKYGLLGHLKTHAA